MPTNKIHNVPNLRFPEFEGEWKKKKLGEIVTIKGGFAFDTKMLYTEKKKYQIVKMGNLYQNLLDLSKNPSYIDELNDKQYKFLLKKNDIVITLTGTTNKHDYGYSYLLKNETNLLLNQRCALIRVKDNDTYFLSYLVKTRHFLEQFFQSSAGGTGNQTNVSTKTMETFVVHIPQKDEQQKVGRFLSFLDQRIETQNKIIEQYKSLIKGIIQTLTIRNRKIGTWKLQYLRDILIERKENNTDNYTIFSVSVSKGVINQIEYLGRSFAAKNTSNYHVVHIGDIVYTKSPTGEFPYGIIKQSFIHGKVAVSPLYGVYIPNNIYIGTYLHYYFNSSINTNNYLSSLTQKGAKNTINITNQRFLDNYILLPTDSREIQKIALTLNIINQKIENEQRFLEQLENQKKYLLQQMLI